MQKARQNIRIKWMLEDLIHEINGCSNVGYQRPHMRKVIDHHNRDRVGGHHHSDLKIKSVENMFSDEVGTARRKSIKKVNRKAQRNDHKKVIAEALLDYTSCHETPYDSLHEQFVEEEREYQRDQLIEWQNQPEQENHWLDDDDQLYDDMLTDYPDFDYGYIV